MEKAQNDNKERQQIPCFNEECTLSVTKISQIDWQTEKMWSLYMYGLYGSSNNVTLL